MQKVDTDKVSLRKYGIIMGVAFLVIAGIIFLKRGSFNYPVLSVSLFFFLAGIFLPFILKPVYIVWMWLAHLLSWFNTRLLLLVIYLLLFTPISLILKLFRRDLIDIRIDRTAGSYWKKKEKNEFVPADYERQY